MFSDSFMKHFFENMMATPTTPAEFDFDISPFDSKSPFSPFSQSPLTKDEISSIPYQDDFFDTSKLLCDMHLQMLKNLRKHDPFADFCKDIELDKPLQAFDRRYVHMMHDLFPRPPRAFQDSQGRQCFYITFSPNEENQVASALIHMMSPKAKLRVEKYLVAPRAKRVQPQFMYHLKQRVWVVRQE